MRLAVLGATGDPTRRALLPAIATLLRLDQVRDGIFETAAGRRA